jgi:hypothetical protein
LLALFTFQDAVFVAFSSCLSLGIFYQFVTAATILLYHTFEILSSLFSDFFEIFFQEAFFALLALALFASASFFPSASPLAPTGADASCIASPAILRSLPSLRFRSTVLFSMRSPPASLRQLYYYITLFPFCQPPFSPPSPFHPFS